jgi:hypothetical protein
LTACSSCIFVGLSPWLTNCPSVCLSICLSAYMTVLPTICVALSWTFYNRLIFLANCVWKESSESVSGHVKTTIQLIHSSYHWCLDLN